MKFLSRHLVRVSMKFQRCFNPIGIRWWMNWLIQTIPEIIRTKQPIQLDSPKTEYEMLNELREIAKSKCCFSNRILARDITIASHQVLSTKYFWESRWFVTQYTPYQPEIRRDVSKHSSIFKTMVADFTGCLLETLAVGWSTAAAEAMAMALWHRQQIPKPPQINFYFYAMLSTNYWCRSYACHTAPLRCRRQILIR